MMSIHNDFMEEMQMGGGGGGGTPPSSDIPGTDVVVSGGDATGAGLGGALILTGGESPNGVGGDIIIQFGRGGDGGDPTLPNVNPGSVIIGRRSPIDDPAIEIKPDSAKFYWHFSFGAYAPTMTNQTSSVSTSLAFGHDEAGQIQMHCSASMSGAHDLLKMTFGKPYGSQVGIVLFPANAAATGIHGLYAVGDSTGESIMISTAGDTFVSGTTYAFSYRIVF